MSGLLGVLLVNAATATLLALVVALLGRVVKRPAVIHALWVLVLVKLLTPPLFEIGVIPRSVSAPVASVREAPAPLVASAARLVPASSGSLAPEAATDPATPVRERPVLPAGALVWLAGAGCVLALATVRARRFHRLLRGTEPAPAALQARTELLASRMGLARYPEVRLVAARISPMLWLRPGVPWLLFPARLLDRLSEEERETLLVHELAHLRRRDPWVRYLELLAGSVFWWHPVVWWARRSLHRVEEQCCDAWVVRALPSHPRAYARALLKTLEFLAGSGIRTPALASGIGEVRHVKERLVMIMKRRSPATASGLQRLVLALVALTALLIFPTWADRSPAAGGVESDRAQDAAARHRDGVLALEREAAQLEEQLQGIHARRMELELEWNLAREEAELARVAEAAEELEAAGRTDEAAAVRSSERLLRRSIEMERERARIELDRARRMHELELPLRRRMQEIEELESRGEHDRAVVLRREVEAMHRELDEAARQADLRMEDLDRALSFGALDSMRNDAERLERQGHFIEAEEIRREAARLQVQMEVARARRSEELERARQYEIEALDFEARKLTFEAQELEVEGRKLTLEGQELEAEGRMEEARRLRETARELRERREGAR